MNENDHVDQRKLKQVAARYLADAGEKAKRYLQHITTYNNELLILISDVRDNLDTWREWVNWVGEHIGFDKDEANRRLRVGRWVRMVRDLYPDIVPSLPFEFGLLDELSRFNRQNIELLPDFVASHPNVFHTFTQFSRDLLRIEVKRALGLPITDPAAPSPQQVIKRLPDWKDIKRALSDPEVAQTEDPHRHIDYSCAHMSFVLRSISKVDGDHKKNLLILADAIRKVVTEANDVPGIL